MTLQFNPLFSWSSFSYFYAHSFYFLSGWRGLQFLAWSNWPTRWNNTKRECSQWTNTVTFRISLPSSIHLFFQLFCQAGWGYNRGYNFWLVPLGRRDGTTASEEAVNEQIPSPFEPLQNITAKFTSKGLDLKDVVVLSGSSSLPCPYFNLLNFDSKKK